MPERSEKICVVDDDLSVLKALGRLLDSAGLQMLLFNDPRLFLEHARNYPIAIAIIDVWMPQLNGLEVQRLLVDMVPATPVIMMTAMDNPGDFAAHWLACKLPCQRFVSHLAMRYA